MSKSKAPPAVDETLDTAQEAVPTTEPTPFCSVAELDGKWAIICNGATVIVGSKHDLASMPVAGVFSAVANAVNSAMGTVKA